VQGSKASTSSTLLAASKSRSTRRSQVERLPHTEQDHWWQLWIVPADEDDGLVMCYFSKLRTGDRSRRVISGETEIYLGGVKFEIAMQRRI
jgi:hypothetical protein